MSAPSPSTAEPRADIAATLESYDLAASRQGFVAFEIAPVFDAPRVSGDYKVLAADQLLQDHPTERAPDGSYRRADFSVGEKSYSTKERGFEVPVDDNLKQQYRDYFDAEAVAAEIARDVLLRQCEQKIVTPAQDTSNVGGNTGVDTQWNAANSTPIDDVLAAMFEVRGKCGLMPNTMVLDILLFKHLLQNDQILDRLSTMGTSEGRRDVKIANKTMLEQIFDVERIVVADSQKNAVIPHQHASNAKLNLQPLWNPAKVLLAHVDRRNRLQMPTFARTFHWADDGSELMGRVESYRDERVRGDVVRVRNQLDLNIVMEECAYLLTGCYVAPE